MATLSQITSSVQKLLSMYDGQDVQVYAEDRIILMINQAFEQIFDNVWWDRYITRETYTLDGSTGVITGDLTNKLINFTDLYCVHYEDDIRPLTKAPLNTNITIIKEICLIPYASDAAKMLKIYPITTTGDIHLTYRTRYSYFDNPNTEIPMDNQLLTNAAAYEFLVDDATNDAAAEKFMRKRDTRYNTLDRLESTIPYSTRDTTSTKGLYDWRQEA